LNLFFFSFVIPAKAGMTNMKVFFKIHPLDTLFVGCIESKTKHCQQFVFFLESFHFRF